MASSTQHSVKQGEHVSRIATDCGFTDYRSIWDYPENAELRKQRQNPNILFPGDQLIIPEKENKEVPGGTEQRHRFEARIQKLKLRVVLRDASERPIGSVKCDLRLENQVLQVAADARGQIELVIPATAERAELAITDPGTPLSGVPLPIKIGHLDPLDELSGQMGRLSNLGYFAGAIEGEHDEMQFRSAVEEFQCEHGLKVDGICGPATQAKLKEIYGC